jgi:hypothetical protein
MHSWDMWRKPLNTDFEIKNEGQHCKIGTLEEYLWEGRE